MSRRVWMRIVCGAFVVCGGVRFVQLIQHELAGPPRSRDAVVVAEQAFRRAIPYLPAHGPVGYLQTEADRSNAADQATFARAQYVLAPCLLVAGATADVVLAVVGRDGYMPDVPSGYQRVQTLTGTLAVYQRVP